MYFSFCKISKKLSVKTNFFLFFFFLSIIKDFSQTGRHISLCERGKNIHFLYRLMNLFKSNLQNRQLTSNTIVKSLKSNDEGLCIFENKVIMFSYIMFKCQILMIDRNDCLSCRNIVF